MPLVVESTSTNAVSNSSSVTVNKPTGTVSGDLLLLLANGTELFPPTSTGFTQSVAQQTNNGGSVKDISVAILYKIAGSSEPASYDVNVTGTNAAGAATLLRISGWNVGDPIFASATFGGNHDTNSETLSTGTISLTRPSNSLLVHIIGHQGNNVVTASNYTRIAGSANPTWTEVQDETYDVSAGGSEVCIATAYANDTDTDDVTRFDVDIVSTPAGDPEGYAGIFAVIAEPLAANATSDFLTISPTFFSNSTLFGGGATSDFHETTPTFFTNSSTAFSPTVWTTISKT